MTLAEFFKLNESDEEVWLVDNSPNKVRHSERISPFVYLKKATELNVVSFKAITEDLICVYVKGSDKQ